MGGAHGTERLVLNFARLLRMASPIFNMRIASSRVSSHILGSKVAVRSATICRSKREFLRSIAKE